MTYSTEEMVEHAKEAARRAWQAMAPFHRGQFRVYEKQGEGPATDADLAADAAILDYLRPRYGDAGFLTEETGDSAERLACELCWIIDPIDGTREFIEGRSDFAVHIALVRRDPADGLFHPLVSVVSVPKANRLYWAVQGGGAWVEPAEAKRGSQARRLTVAPTETLGGARAVVTRAPRGARLQEALRLLAPAEIYTLGSLGIKVVELLEARASLYINTGRRSCKEWDVCAPDLILREAGGRISDLLGNDFTYNKADYLVYNGLLASNGRLHRDALGKLRAVANWKHEG